MRRATLRSKVRDLQTLSPTGKKHLLLLWWNRSWLSGGTSFLDLLFEVVSAPTVAISQFVSLALQRSSSGKEDYLLRSRILFCRLPLTLLWYSSISLQLSLSAHCITSRSSFCFELFFRWSSSTEAASQLPFHTDLHDSQASSSWAIPSREQQTRLYFPLYNQSYENL